MKLSKAKKELGEDFVKEMEAKNDADLKGVIVEATFAIKKATDDIESNKDYVAAKEIVGTFNAGKREVLKRQKAKIVLAQALLSKEQST